MGGFAPDGLTYYLGQSNRGIGGFMHIVDVSDPSNPKQLPTWQFLGDGRPHDVKLNEDGTRLYAGQPGLFGNTGSSIGPNGLVILDVSDYQFRRPNPQIQIISKLFWEDQRASGADVPLHHQRAPAHHQHGRVRRPGGCWGCSRPHVPGGRPRMVIAQIIDISDERNPKIVSKLMLEVQRPRQL